MLRELGKKMIIGFAVVSLLVVIAMIETGEAQPLNVEPKMKRDCVLTIDLVNETLANRTWVYGINSSNETYAYWNITGFYVAEVEQTTKVCERYIKIGRKEFHFADQGYNCTKRPAGHFVCDSCSDGNCDGKCSDSGGETCCRVSSQGNIRCKNAVVGWNKGTRYIAIDRLEQK